MRASFGKPVAIVLQLTGAYGDACEAGQSVAKTQPAHVAAVATQPITAELTLASYKLLLKQQLQNIRQHRAFYVASPLLPLLLSGQRHADIYPWKRMTNRCVATAIQ